MNLNYCLQRKEKIKNKKTFNCDKLFLFSCFRLLEFLLNLMIVSMFVLDSRQEGDIWNCELQIWWPGINVRLETLPNSTLYTLLNNFPVYWVEIFQNVTQCFFLFQICLLSMTLCREFPSDECKNKIRFKKIYGEKSCSNILEFLCPIYKP